MNISILGINIKRIREEKGLSAYKLAKIANVGVSTISQIETGKRQSLQSSTVSKIATALKISTDELMATKTNVEYVVTDIEQTINLVLSSDELLLDDVELTREEKNQFKMAIDIASNSIRKQRENKGGDK